MSRRKKIIKDQSRNKEIDNTNTIGEKAKLKGVFFFKLTKLTCPQIKGKKKAI